MEGGAREEEAAAIILIVSNKIDEAYAWLKDKSKTLFTLIPQSIRKALDWFIPFVTCCCEKLKEVLSGVNTQMEKSSEWKPVVGKRLTEKGSSLQDEIKMLIQNVRKLLPMHQWRQLSSSRLEMKLSLLKLKKFLDFAEGFILLEYYCNNPVALIPLLYEGYMNYCMPKQVAGVFLGVPNHKNQAAMAAIITLFTLL